MIQAQPASVFERVRSVDAIRGFALFGILFANVPFWHQYNDLYDTRGFIVGTPKTDYLFNMLFHLLVERKFVPIFSMLFGFGFYVQLQKAAARQQPFQAYFIKRMGWLLVIAVLHGYLLWSGDIIRNYAICGFFLLLIYRWSAKKLLWWSIVFSVLLTTLVFIIYQSFNLATYSFDSSIIAEQPVTNSYGRYLYINWRTDSFTNFIQDTPLIMLFCFGNMLIGVWLGKIGFFHQTARFKKMRRLFDIFGLTFGIACSYLFYQMNTGGIEITPALLWLPFVIVSGLILQSLAYISLFIELQQKFSWRKLVRVFEPVGKMALSNYLLQSVFYTLLFFHWPGLFQLYGKITLTETYLLCLLIFGAQVVLSKWWLKKYQQGPVEFVWKKLLHYSTKKAGNE